MYFTSLHISAHYGVASRENFYVDRPMILRGDADHVLEYWHPLSDRRILSRQHSHHSAPFLFGMLRILILAWTVYLSDLRIQGCILDVRAPSKYPLPE